VSEYLSEEEQVARMKSWWDENGTTVIVSVVVAVAAVLGWNWYGNYQEGQTFSASSAYETYLDAEADAKNTAAAQLAEQFPGSAYHVLVLFDQAQAALAAGDLAAAEARLSEVVAAGDDELLVDLAKIRLAKVQQALDRSGEALTTLSSVRGEGFRSWGLEAKGDIHVSRGELQLAYEAYRAAMDSLGEGAPRPLLEMKMGNVAPTEGEYVQFTDTLGQALEAAQESLQQSEEVVAPAEDKTTEQSDDASDDETSDE
jgi:predicted negative regulator of RcsB-dependent stress response